LIYLESPVRLTGAAYTADEVSQIANLIQQFDAAAIWDQGLAPWVASGEYVSLGSVSGLAERVAVLGECWPGVGLESWFIGYIGANPEWLESMRSQKQIMAICTSTASQYAALEAAEVYAQRHAEQWEKLHALHQAALARVKTLGGEALTGEAVNLLAVRFPAAQTASDQLRQAGFEGADGVAFGAPDMMRLAVTYDNTVERALSAFS
jgi:aspartate/methionine/tyrosine aminotransferase